MATYSETAAGPRPAVSERRGVKIAEVGPARFVSEPAALGLAAFGLTTMALSFVNAGILSTKILPVFEARSVQQDVGP